ncbi:hypothetical protein GCM10023324_23180 [Streptomyces youssoufiensis]
MDGLRHGGGAREGEGEFAGVEQGEVDADAERGHEVGGVAEQGHRRAVPPGARHRKGCRGYPVCTALARFVLEVPTLARGQADRRAAVEAIFDILTRGWQPPLPPGDA